MWERGPSFRVQPRVYLPTVNYGLFTGTSMIIRDMNILHPKCRAAFTALADDLIASHEAGQTKTLFKVFETFREPYRQDELRIKGASKARPWESAHNYGLAVDFVPYIDGKDAVELSLMINEDVHEGWNWNASFHDWAFLKSRAEKHGLAVPIRWDQVHVQPIWFDRWRRAI